MSPRKKLPIPLEKSSPVDTAASVTDDVTPHEVHLLAETYSFICPKCLTEVRRMFPGDQAIHAWSSPTTNEKTGKVSPPGSCIPRSIVNELKKQSLSLGALS